MVLQRLKKRVVAAMVWVDGHGPVNACGMVVGEAPGLAEVESGVPFVGPGGQLFDAALLSLGVQRERLYLTNVVKSFPSDAAGGPRTPTHEEIRSWAPELLDEIQRYSGVPILALGRVASVTLAGRWLPGRCARGSVFVAWHPTYVLHRRSHWQDWLGQLAEWSRRVVSLSTDAKRKDGI